MASEIRVTNIKANDGTSSLTVANSTGNVSVGGTLTSTGAITASGGIANAGTISQGTLGASVIFPTGIIETQNVIKYALSSNNSYTNEGTTEKITTRKTNSSALVEDISVLGGHTYIYTYQFWLEAWRNSGSNTASRSAKVRLYDDENNHSQGDSSSFGTLIAYGVYGREMYSSAGSSNTSYAFVTISGASYYSSDDTRYIYITTQPPASNHRNAVYMTPTFPMYLKIEKIKGNVLTTRSS